MHGVIEGVLLFQEYAFHTINEKVYLSKQIIGIIVEIVYSHDTDQTVARGIRDFLAIDTVRLCTRQYL